MREYRECELGLHAGLCQNPASVMYSVTDGFQTFPRSSLLPPRVTSGPRHLLQSVWDPAHVALTTADRAREALVPLNSLKDVCFQVQGASYQNPVSFGLRRANMVPRFCVHRPFQKIAS